MSHKIRPWGLENPHHNEGTPPTSYFLRHPKIVRTMKNIIWGTRNHGTSHGGIISYIYIYSSMEGLIHWPLSHGPGLQSMSLSEYVLLLMKLSYNGIPHFLCRHVFAHVGKYGRRWPTDWWLLGLCFLIAKSWPKPELDILSVKIIIRWRLMAHRSMAVGFHSAPHQ